MLVLGTLNLAGCAYESEITKPLAINAYDSAPCEIVSDRLKHGAESVNGFARLSYEDLISDKDRGSKRLFLHALSKRRAAERQGNRCPLPKVEMSPAAKQIIDKFGY